MKNLLKVLRAERDWTQAELARRLDVSRESINAIETRRYDPSLPLAFEISKLFGKKSRTSFCIRRADVLNAVTATAFQRNGFSGSAANWEM